jgi:hypothetical protein
LEQLMSWESVNYRRVTIKMSDGLVYSGRVNICDYPRLSDFFKNSDTQFITVISEGDDPEKVMLLKKTAIIWAEAKD